jgi:hypothetical protein
MKRIRENSRYWDREYDAIIDEYGHFPVRRRLSRREQLISDIEFYSTYKAKSDRHKARIRRKLAEALLEKCSIVADDN